MRSLPIISPMASWLMFACAASAPRGPSISTAERPAPPEAPLAELFPAPLRLTDEALPRAYTLTLRIDPAAPTFTGEERIEVLLARPTRLVRLHAEGLTITRAAAVAGDQTIPLEARSEGGSLALVSPTPLPAGAVVLSLAWQGPLPETPVGIYRVQDGGRWSVYTQFEPLEARLAFPSFDEPRFKTPYTLALELPDGLRAFSNAPEQSPRPAGDGWLRIAFDPTPPLPSYLVAFAIGDFDVLAGPNVSHGRVPFRLIAPHGKGTLGGFALDKAPRYLDQLEAWFGVPYPYAKLDLVAVPSFSSSGMENAGLITFREALLLLDGEAAPIEDRVWCESVLAHELAHMWLGDLVTMAWWDDLWLNEAFAVWMGRKAVTAVSPELDIAEQALRSKFGVMLGDARLHARAVRQPIRSEGDIYNAFDGITYSKGAAVLAMLEQWIGPERFQLGVRAYLAEHAHGSATTADLLARLGHEGAGATVDAVMASFVDQPGVPQVGLSWRCEAAGQVALELTQAPYRLLGDPRTDTSETWQIPICLRLSDGQHQLDHCQVLSERRATWPVHAGFCPTFAHPNIAEAGYFGWQATLGPISLVHTDKAAFAGFVANLRGGVASGRLPLTDLLDGIEPLFEASVSPSELDDLVGALGLVARYDPEAPDDARFQKKAGAWLLRVPLDLGLGDSPRERRRMPTLVRALARLTHDPRVLGHAAKVARAFFAALEGQGRSTVALEDAGVYLPLHCRGLGQKPPKAARREVLWKRLRAALDLARTPSERALVIEALASFDDPALVVRSYDLILDKTLRAQDLRTLSAATSTRKEVAHAVWNWLTTNFAAVLERLGPKAAPGLPQLAAGFCSLDEAREVETFFSARQPSLPDGLQRPLALTLEGIRACAAARERYGAEARAWYQR